MKTLIILSALLVVAVIPACAEDASPGSRYLSDGSLTLDFNPAPGETHGYSAGCGGPNYALQLAYADDTLAAPESDSSSVGAASDQKSSEPKPTEGTHKAQVRKSPGTAFALSLLFPGLGQHYNGEHTKGAVQEVLFFGGATMAFLGIVAGFSDSSPSWSETVAIGGLILCPSAYVWSVFDAPISAFRINDEIERSQRSSMQFHVGDDGTIIRVGMLPAGIQIGLSSQF